MRRIILPALTFAVAALASAQTVTVSFSSSVSKKPLDGRILLLLSNDASAEPRMQIDDTPRSQQVFGGTVEGLKPGEEVIVGDTAKGYPRASLKDVPAGDYTIQAVLNIYQTFHLATGKTVKLAPDRGEGQHWNTAPGNLYSIPRKVHIGSGGKIHIELDKVIPPIPPVSDTTYIRHIRIQSRLLSEFWGTPMYLSAVVLVPEGFDSHPNAHYPEMVFEDHFVTGFSDFRTLPPDPDLKLEYSERFHQPGYNLIMQQEALQELPGLDRTRNAALSGHQDPARQPLLRRQLRSELSQSRPLRRRH